MSVSVSQLGELRPKKDPSQVWVTTFLWLGSQTEPKGEPELSTSMHCSLLADCGCNMTSCIRLHPIASSHMEDCTLKL